MRSPLDYLARRLFREPFDWPLSLTRKAPIDMRRVLAKAINAEPGNGLSSLPVPATTGQRVTAAELADAVTADPTPNPSLVNECSICNPDGGKRPDSREGREGR